jgi:long-chain acyl-CoA synthetase
VGGAAPAAPPARSEAEKVLAKLAAGRRIGPETTLDELGLSSLERVELMVALNLDETQVSAAKTVADLAAPPRALAREAAEVPESFPRWARSWWAQTIRVPFVTLVVLPLLRVFAWLKVEGRDNLAGLQGPVIFAPNHQSYMDTPALLAALPWRYRWKLAPTMSKNFFEAHFHPERFPLAKVLRNRLAYYLAALVFQGFALPQQQTGTGEALRYAGELVSNGYSILIFPEGQHTRAGEIGPFRPGVGMMAAKLEVPVVPVRLTGFDRVLNREWKMARPGRVKIRFGKPVRLAGEDYAELAKQVEAAVRQLEG